MGIIGYMSCNLLMNVPTKIKEGNYFCDLKIFANL